MSSRGRLLSYCRDFRLPQRLDGLNINLKWDLTHDVHFVNWRPNYPVSKHRLGENVQLHALGGYVHL